MGRQPLPTNTILGIGGDQYRIDTVLGPGGFGVTYLARDMRFDRDVAIKEYFPAEFAYRDGTTTIRSSTRGTVNDFFEQGKRHFLDEARTLAKFRHPHIVRVLNLFEQFNTAYMVLEFEEGQSLKAWLKGLGRRPTQAELDAILIPLLSALETVHSKGMFHRDIAPDNIIVRPSGEPVLIDFGAARRFVREHSHTIGAIVKHGYSPPEQYTLDTKLQGAWSDIYSLSATIYAAMMGAPPEEAAKRQLSDHVLPLEEHLPRTVLDTYRPPFIAAIGAGLALRPRERPQSVVQFRALLERQPRRGEAPALEAAIATPGRSSRALVAEGERRSSIAAGAPAASATPVASSRLLEPGPRPAPPSEDGPAPAPEDAAYPESTARNAALVALAVAALAAFAFLSIGGIEHPGGLAAAMLVCTGLLASLCERALAVTRAPAIDVGRASMWAAVVAALALAVYWLPFFFWQVSLLLAAVAALFASLRFGRWVPLTMLGLALLHLALAALLLALATRATQKDPYFLPMMALSLAGLAGLTLTSAVSIRRRWEAPAT